MNHSHSDNSTRTLHPHMVTVDTIFGYCVVLVTHVGYYIMTYSNMENGWALEISTTTSSISSFTHSLLPPSPSTSFPTQLTQHNALKSDPQCWFFPSLALATFEWICHVFGSVALDQWLAKDDHRETSDSQNTTYCRINRFNHRESGAKPSAEYFMVEQRIISRCHIKN